MSTNLRCLNGVWWTLHLPLVGSDALVLGWRQNGVGEIWCTELNFSFGSVLAQNLCMRMWTAIAILWWCLGGICFYHCVMCSPPLGWTIWVFVCFDIFLWCSDTFGWVQVREPVMQEKSTLLIPNISSLGFFLGTWPNPLWSRKRSQLNESRESICVFVCGQVSPLMLEFSWIGPASSARAINWRLRIRWRWSTSRDSLLSSNR